MDLKACYEELGGDYEGTLARLYSEKLVRKFVLKFPDDRSHEELHRYLGEGNYGEAFRMAHTIKGMCQNLGFTRLYESSAALTEALRDGWTPEAEPLLRRVDEDYSVTRNAIIRLRSE